jgi:hypothetical protein
MTVILRKVIASIFAVLALLSVVIAIIFGSSSRIVEQTIQNSHEISKSFSLASGFVERFKSEHGRPPYENEFSDWAKTQSGGVHSVQNMEIMYFQQQFPPEVIEKFGSPPIDSYIIIYWRGEWFEYYASWVNASTLEFEAKKYYLLGSALVDGLAIFSFSAILGVLARYIWPRTTQRSIGSTDRELKH